MAATLIAFLVYLGIVVVIGAVGAKFYTKTTGDFFLGGRKMNEWVVALSAVVSGRSAWLILGLSGYAYKLGINAVWAAVGYIIVELFLFAFLGKRLRRFTQKKDVITIPGYFEERFGDRRHIICIITSLIVAFFFFVYVSAQLMGGGKTFDASFGTGHLWGVVITASIILAYTALGGFVAVSWTDVLQAFFMILALVILPVVAIVKLGGVNAVFSRLSEVNFEALGGAAGAGLSLSALSIGAVIGFIAIGLGSPGNPHILVRYMSVREPRLLRKCALVGTVWNVVMAWGAVFAGLAARALLPDASQLPLKGASPDYDKSFILLAEHFMHPVLFGFIIAAIFAAIMSTVDSQLLVVSSSVTRDFYRRIFKAKADEKKSVLVGRISVAVILVAAVLLGYFATESVFWLVLFAWAGLGAAIGPAIILSLYWRRMTLTGAVAGVVAGAATAIVWKLTPHLQKNIIKYELLPAFLVSTVVIAVVSLLTKPPADVDEQFKAMKP